MEDPALKQMRLELKMHKMIREARPDFTHDQLRIMADSCFKRGRHNWGNNRGKNRHRVNSSGNYLWGGYTCCQHYSFSYANTRDNILLLIALFEAVAPPITMAAVALLVSALGSVAVSVT